MSASKAGIGPSLNEHCLSRYDAPCQSSGASMRRRKTGGRARRIQVRKSLKPRSAPKATRHRSSVASEEETNAAQFRRARDEALKHLAATDFSKRVKELLKLGPRETGSPSHAKFIDEIAREIESLGLPVHRDSHRFSRWSLQISVQIVSLKLPDRTSLSRRHILIPASPGPRA